MFKDNYDFISNVLRMFVVYNTVTYITSVSPVCKK